MTLIVTQLGVGGSLTGIFQQRLPLGVLPIHWPPGRLELRTIPLQGFRSTDNKFRPSCHFFQSEIRTRDQLFASFSFLLPSKPSNLFLAQVIFGFGLVVVPPPSPLAEPQFSPVLGTFYLTRN